MYETVIPSIGVMCEESVIEVSILLLFNVAEETGNASSYNSVLIHICTRNSSVFVRLAPDKEENGGCVETANKTHFRHAFDR